jgi:hypothetical protein
MHCTNCVEGRALIVTSAARWIACLVIAVVPFATASLRGADDDKAAQREQRLTDMRQKAESFEVARVEAEESVKLERLKDPLLRFDDPAREFHDGTMWAWGKKGRPEVLLTIEQYGAPGKQSTPWFELISLSSGKVTAKVTERLQWTPREPGLVLTPVAGAPDPAETAAGRLKQMRDIARRLAVYEVGTNRQRYELQYKSQPIHRYDDVENGLVDGAIFVFAYGTNPELLLIVEARREDAGKAAWQQGFARTAAAELHVLDGESELWTRPYQYRPTPQDAYWYFQRR